MKYRLKFFLVIIFGFFLFTCNGCKDEIPVLPEVSTTEITLITPISANCSGIAISHGSSTIIEKGICWSDHPQPTISDNIISAELYPYFVSFNLRISGLNENTVYYVRAYATSNDGTGYGDELTFNTSDDISGQTGTVTDIEGNVYETIGIGSQIWTAENLKTTKYNDEINILLIEDEWDWSVTVSPAYSWYNNDTINKGIYGGLYNWNTVNTGKLCPLGWHVPTILDWARLSSFLGGDNSAGGKLKSINDYWLYPNYKATNESGFSALPGGKRVAEGEFFNLRMDCLFWSSSYNQSLNSWYISLSALTADITKGSKDISWGMSIRCIKD